MVFFWLILVQIHQFQLIVTQIQCLGEYNIVGKWLKLHKYEEFQQFFITHLVYYGNCCPIEPLMYISSLILVQLHQFPFIVTQIQFLGDHKIVGNGYSSINMKNYNNIFRPFCIVWISFSRRDFGFFYG